MTEDYTPPRRMRTAFMIYTDHKKEEILEDNPNISETQLLREVTKAWAHLDNDMKQRFMEEASKDKERYIQELNELPIPLFRSKRPRRRRDRRKPKKVLTPYMFYVKEVR